MAENPPTYHFIENYNDLYNEKKSLCEWYLNIGIIVDDEEYNILVNYIEFMKHFKEYRPND